MHELRFKSETSSQPPHIVGDQEVPGETFPHSPAAPVQSQPRQAEHQKPRKEEGHEESPSPQPLQSQPAQEEEIL